MATISINIPTGTVTRVLTAICTRNGYQAVIDGIPNPQTQQDFVKAWLITLIKNEVKRYESQIASSTAATNTITDIDNNVNLT